MMIDTLIVNRRHGFPGIAVAIFVALSLMLMPLASANSDYENCVDDANAEYDDGVEAAENRLASMGYFRAALEIYYDQLQRLSDTLASELNACRDLLPPIAILPDDSDFDDEDDEDNDECCEVNDDTDEEQNWGDENDDL